MTHLKRAETIDSRVTLAIFRISGGDCYLSIAIKKKTDPINFGKFNRRAALINPCEQLSLDSALLM